MSILSDLEAALEAGLGDSHIFPCGRDTIAALVAVARAADELSCIVIEKSLNLDWEYPRGMCKGCEQEALCAALEPLVKEADDE